MGTSVVTARAELILAETNATVRRHWGAVSHIAQRLDG
jgi:hypothetical protein